MKMVDGVGSRKGGGQCCGKRRGHVTGKPARAEACPGDRHDSLRTEENISALDRSAATGAAMPVCDDLAAGCCGRRGRQKARGHAGLPVALPRFKRDNCYYHACVWWAKIGGRVLYRRPEAPLEPETRCTDADEDAFVERVRLLIFSAVR
ncbi:hypothetical protein JCM10599A_66210 [Paraburkholderia kururiensis]